MIKPIKSIIKQIIKFFIRVPLLEILTESTPELTGPSSYTRRADRIPFPYKIDALEQQLRFLVYDNIRVNQLLREMIYLNNLKRGVTGLQTKESFDYQWRELPDGECMPSNPDFLGKAEEYLLDFTAIPKEWFQGKRILDAGCGSGRWTYALKELGAMVTAFDQSDGALNSVRRLVGETTQVELQQGDLLDLPYPDGSFDMVWCFGVPHHTENPLRVLKHLARCVSPGGYVFVMLYAFPESTEAFFEQANYEEWRQRMLHLTNREKMGILQQHFPAQEVHGYFDALSPTINDLFTFEWMEAFFRNVGLVDFHRYPSHPNHHLTARKQK